MRTPNADDFYIGRRMKYGEETVIYVGQSFVTGTFLFEREDREKWNKRIVASVHAFDKDGNRRDFQTYVEHTDRFISLWPCDVKVVDELVYSKEFKKY